MKTKTRLFDPADFLDTKESKIELLADAIETGDIRYIANALGAIALSRGWRQSPGRPDNTTGALSCFERETHPRLTTLLGVTKSRGLKLSFKAA